MPPGLLESMSLRRSFPCTDYSINQTKSIYLFAVVIKAKADSTIEQLKSDLQLRTIEHQVRFSRLHEKQATVIADVYAHLVETLWEAESFLSPVEWNGEPSKKEKYATSINKIIELFRYFDKHRIYLPEHLCDILDQLITEIRGHVTKYGVYLTWDDSSLQEHTRKEKYDAWIGGWEAIRTQIPEVRKKLEDEFRTLLGQQI